MNKRRITFSTAIVVAALAYALVANAGPHISQDEKQLSPAKILGQGKFRLHKFEQPIGEETYRIQQDGNGLAVEMEFKFTDRGTDVPLSAKFRCAADLTPLIFDIKGKTSRVSSIDQTVEVKAGTIRLRNHDKWSEVALPPKFFTISGYAPTTMQMMLVRYWEAHGQPEEIATFPSGRVRVRRRGEDTISVNGKNETLARYGIEGLIWGRETLWFNASRELIAAVTIDAEFDHFESVRDGYESALGTFVGGSGADGMAALAEVSRRVSGSHSSLLAVIGGTLIDGTGKPAVPDSAILIRDGRIVAAGARSDVTIPAGAELVDAHGKTILPGLWDMHAHFEQVEWGPIYLAAGVTTVRDCGNEFEFITAVRDAVANGRGLGPRILAAGIVDGSGKLAIATARVDTPEQAREWVHRYHDAGFQQMKIYSSVKLEEVQAVASEAHRLGMTVTGHVPEGLNAYQVIEAGQDQINHISYMADIMHPPLPAGAKRIDRMTAMAGIDLNSAEVQKALEYLKAHHTVIDPTIALYEFQTASTAKPPASFEPGVNKVAPELAEQLVDVGPPPPPPNTDLPEKVFEKQLAIVGALHKAGITIVAGTDQTVPGYSIYREIELYAQAGFTPMEAIQAATIVPARVMGFDSELGTVEIGKRADLILLDADPLQDIHNIRAVRYVITGGKMYNCAELWQSVGFAP